MTEVAPPDISRVAFGRIVAVPAVPRAGERVDFQITVLGDAQVVHDAIEAEALLADVMLGDEFLHLEYGLRDDGTIYVTSLVPKTAAGERLTVTLTIAPDTPSQTTRVATFRVAGWEIRELKEVPWPS